MSDNNEYIPKDEHDARMDEKEVISAISQNLWAVEFTESIYDLHGHWVDNISDEDIEELVRPLQTAMDEFHTGDGYDDEKIRSLSSSEQEKITNTLYRNVDRAASYFEQIHQRVQGHVDITNDIPNIIDNSVRNSFNEIIDEGDFTGGDFDVSVTTEVDEDTLDLIYNRVEQSIEANLGGTVDDETMDDIYDQLTDIQTEIEAQGRQTRQHVTDQHGDTQGYVDDRHSDTQEYVGDKHDETQTRVTSEAEETRNRIDDVDGRLDDIEGKLGGKSGRRGFLKKALALAGLTGATYLVAEQVNDQDELTNITWGDADPVAQYDVEVGETYSWSEFNICLSAEQEEEIASSLGDPNDFQYQLQESGSGYDVNIIDEGQTEGYFDNEDVSCEVRE